MQTVQTLIRRKLIHITELMIIVLVMNNTFALSSLKTILWICIRYFYSFFGQLSTKNTLLLHVLLLFFLNIGEWIFKSVCYRLTLESWYTNLFQFCGFDHCSQGPFLVEYGRPTIWFLSGWVRWRGLGEGEWGGGKCFWAWICVCVCVCGVFSFFFFSLRESVFLFTFLQSIAFTLVLAIVSGQKMVLIFFLKKSFCDDVSLATELRDVLYNHRVDRPHWSFFFLFIFPLVG